MVYNLHITTDEAGALLELSDSLADQLEGVVEAFNHTIHPAGGYRIYETIHLDADGSTARCPRIDWSMQKQRPHDAANPPEGLGNTGEKPYLCRK